MNIQQIEYILAVSDLRNFSQAADRCFVTQSTLSTMIARFEEEIGLTIFDRRTKPVSTTQEGERIIRQLSVISRELHNLEHIVKLIKGEQGGDLRIGVIPTVAPYLLPLFLNAFVQQVPDIHFVFSEITTEKILELIEARALDIGIVSTPLNHPGIEEIPLYHEPFLLYDRSDHGVEDYFAISEIDSNRLWLLEEGHCMRNQVKRICGLRKKRSVQRNLDYKSGTIDTLLKFVKRNQGITLLPFLATIDLPEQDQIFLKRFQQPVPARTIGLVIHPHFVKNTMLEKFSQAIVQNVMPLLEPWNSELEVISPK